MSRENSPASFFLPLPLPLKNRKWQAHSYHSRSLQFPDRSRSCICLRTTFWHLLFRNPENECLPAIRLPRNCFRPPAGKVSFFHTFLVNIVAAFHFYTGINDRDRRSSWSFISFTNSGKSWKFSGFKVKVLIGIHINQCPCRSYPKGM